MNISLYQKRFWLEWKLDPNSSKYNTPLIYQIEGDLNFEALSQALFTYINEFHRCARHYFCEEEGEIKQKVLETIPVNIECEDISRTLVDVYIQKICNHVFDLSTPPLFKFGLLKIQGGPYILILNFHHIVTDAYSGVFLVENLSKLYNHYAKNTSFPTITQATFEEYLINERLYYPAQKETEALQHWKSKLADHSLTIPFNFKKQNYHQGFLKNEDNRSVYFSLDAEVTFELKQLSKSLGATIFIVLSALYALLLYRYTRQKLIVISYPVNTRPSGFTKVPGCFVNNVPLIVDFNTDRTFKDLIQACIVERKENKTHQFCSLTEIIQNLKKEKGVIENNYFNVSIIEAFLNPEPLDLKDLEVSCIKHHPLTTFNDLSLFYQSTNNLEFRLNYRINCFDKPMIDQFIKHFIFIIKQCLLDPNKKINDFSLLQEDELQLIENWNDTYRSFPEEKTLSQLFLDQVLKTPDRIAVSYEEKAFTYKDLNIKSNYVSNILRKYSSVLEKNNCIIALCLDKGLEWVVGVLGVLKTGFAYVPIDPNDAENRIKMILEDADVQVVLTLKKTLKLLPFLGDQKREIILLDFDQLDKQSDDLGSLFSKMGSRKLAYCIYTSGTTGKPKGVMVEERSIINLVFDVKEKLNITYNDRLLSVTSVIFDIYALELYLSLLTGALHVICPRKIVEDPFKLSAFIRKNKPTWVQGTPSLLSMVVPYLKKEECQFTILCGGESLSESLAKKLMNLSNKVWNVYGPTETTIWSSFFKLEKDLPPYIGRGFANTKLQVLDENHNPVPIGVVGELYISGVGLARGYLNEPELTKNKFINNIKTNVLMYKTEDWVRWTEFGYLEYIGRFDTQVKIRGHRIELSEIEAVLRMHPAIVDCVVDIQKQDDQEKIISYYVLKKNSWVEKILKLSTDLNNHDLYSHLKKYLPDYMLPVAYVQLETLPLTIQGKIDKRKLPIPGLEHHLLKQELSKPFDVVELKLREIWGCLLNIPEIAINHNFFNVGGDSLLSVHLVSKINEQFKVQYTVPWVLENNTIKLQAENIRSNQNAIYTYNPLISFNKEGKKQPLFLVHPGLAGAEVYSEFARHLDKNIPFYALDSYNLNSGKPFIKTVEELARHYIKEIRTLQPTGPYLLGGWSLGGVVAYEMAQQLTRLGEVVQTLYLLDSHIYSKEYLEMMYDLISVDGLIEQLPEDRGQYLASLPEQYLEKVLASLKNDIKLLISYIIRPYAGRIFLTKTTKTTSLNRGLIESRYNGWKKYATVIDKKLINSTHFALMEGEQAKQVAYFIQEDINL